MLRWPLFLLTLALVTGLFGFVGPAHGAYVSAKVLFVIFLALFVVALVFDDTQARRTQ